jgi:hypothetical protein
MRDLDPSAYIDPREQAQVSLGLSPMLQTDGNARYQNDTSALLQRAMMEDPSKIAGIALGTALSSSMGGADPYGATEDARNRFLDTAGNVGQGMIDYDLANKQRIQGNIVASYVNLGMPLEQAKILATTPATMDAYNAQQQMLYKDEYAQAGLHLDADKANALTSANYQKVVAQQNQALAELQAKQEEQQRQAQQEADKQAQQNAQWEADQQRKWVELNYNVEQDTHAQSAKDAENAWKQAEFYAKPQHFISPQGVAYNLSLNAPTGTGTEAKQHALDTYQNMTQRANYLLSTGGISKDQYKTFVKSIESSQNNNPLFRGVAGKPKGNPLSNLLSPFAIKNTTPPPKKGQYDPNRRVYVK